VEWRPELLIFQKNRETAVNAILILGPVVDIGIQAVPVEDFLQLIGKRKESFGILFVNDGLTQVPPRGFAHVSSRE
jgi:hypothetical protein